MIESYIRQLVNYLKKNISKGYTLEALKWALINQGYSRTEISHAIDIMNKELAEEAPKFKEKPIIRHEIIGEDDEPITIKKPFWKRIFG